MRFLEEKILIARFLQWRKAGNFLIHLKMTKNDKEKAAHFLKSLIILDKLQKFPTAKEITKEFFASNADNKSKIEAANYILNGFYTTFRFGNEFDVKRNLSPFMEEVITYVDNELETRCPLGTNFNCVRREAVFWLINNDKTPKEAVLPLLKEKVDWFDIPTQNGILDYCYKNNEKLGNDFVMNIFEKAAKVNMREVRLVALRYAYLLTRDNKYLIIMEKDPSSYIRRKAETLKDEKASKDTAFG